MSIQNIQVKSNNRFLTLADEQERTMANTTITNPTSRRSRNSRPVGNKIGKINGNRLKDDFINVLKQIQGLMTKKQHCIKV